MLVDAITHEGTSLIFSPPLDVTVTLHLIPRPVGLVPYLICGAPRIGLCLRVQAAIVNNEVFDRLAAELVRMWKLATTADCSTWPQLHQQQRLVLLSLAREGAATAH